MDEPKSPSPASVRGEATEASAASRYDTEVRVVDCSVARSPSELHFLSNRSEHTPKSPEEFNHPRQQHESNRSPAQETDFPNGELEGAILLVEDPGRTRKS